MRTFFISTLLVISLAAFGQTTDSVSWDLKQLTDLDFFKKYSFYDSATAKQDIKVTKCIWSVGQLRATDKSFRQLRVSTFTIIDRRPTTAYRYIIGHYQLPTPDHLTRMSYYRIDTLRKTVDYQDLDDFIKDKWKRINSDH